MTSHSCVDECAPALCDQLEHVRQVHVSLEGTSDLGRRLEPAHSLLEFLSPRIGTRVQTRVVDCDRGEVGEDGGRLLVGLVERPVVLLGEV